MSSAEPVLSEQTTETPADTSQETSEPRINLSADAKAAESQPADGQPDEGAKQENASEDAGKAPVYEPFNLPDGVTVADEDLAVFTELGQKYGLDQDGAQGMIDLSLKVQETAVNATLEHLEQQTQQEIQGWRDALQSDKELGGDNLETTQKLVTAFESTGLASNELLDVLESKGLIYHPEMVKMMTTIGKMVSESPINFAGGDGAGDGMTPAQKMFAKSGHQ